MPEPTNADRANWARRAIKHHAKISKGDDEDAETKIADMLANTMHLCAEIRVDFCEVVGRAMRNYSEERRR